VPTLAVQVDVTSADDLERARADIVGSLGVPQILVNAAGIALWADAETIPAEQ
jgi:NAD(P)-dependent dehydrogenase (short-subunit alcohol dehydrogenase family)